MDFLYIIELTVSFETKLGNTARRKMEKYKDLEISFKPKYKQVRFVNIVISTLSVFDDSSVDFLDMLKDMESDQTCRHCLVKKIMAIAVRTAYYVFCGRNKNWDDPKLIKFWKFSFISSCFFVFLVPFKWPIINYLFRGVCSLTLVNIPRNEVWKINLPYCFSKL